MEKLKTMWNDLSKKGKLFAYALAVIIILVIVNAVI
jgi:flagellar biosynthesis/type III secretory pathway M-ring protein FliF/YscJ|tara:strand:+ start:97 stop:204 length:108 start_codon:yes stop_codon:yes gene_type:complete